MSSELDRLTQSPSESEKPGGLGTVRIIVSCPGNAAEVLSTARSTLIAALKLCEAGVFHADTWKRELPEEFTRNSSPHPSNEDIERQMARPLEERIEAQQDAGWSVEMFMNSFSPEVAIRYWQWWDAAILDERHIAVAVEVSEWPFPWQSLRWLFRGSGANDVVAEE